MPSELQLTYIKQLLASCRRDVAFVSNENTKEVAGAESLAFFIF